METIRTVPPSPELTWQYRQWDNAMADIQDRYRFYANEPEKETKPAEFDPITKEAADSIRAGTGCTSNPRPVLDKSAADAVSDLETVESLRAFTEQWEEPGSAYEPTREELEWLAVQELFRRRESALCALIRNRARDNIDPVKWADSLAARQRLNEDSVWIASMLHAGGEKGFKPSHAPRAAILDLLTGMVLDLPHTVGKNFIPCEAAKKRAKTLIAAEYWGTRNPLDRYFVFHGPGRVLISEVRETIKKIQRKLSKLNGEPFMKAAGVRFTLRVSEVGGLTFDRIRSTGEKIERVLTRAKNGRFLVKLYGRKGERWIDGSELETVEHRDGVGRWTFYPHVNALAHFSKGKINGEPGPIDPKTGKPGPSDWSRFLSRIHEYWEWGWKECGGIEDVREAIKYCAKPADLRRLGATELCELARQLFRLHLVQALGPVRAEMSARRKGIPGIGPVKLARFRNSRTGRLEIREKPDWNARKKDRHQTPEQAMRERIRRDLKHRLQAAALKANEGKTKPTVEPQGEFAVTGTYAPELALPTPAAPKAEPARGPAPRPVGARAAMLNRVVARMVGTSGFSPHVVPQVLVWNYVRTPETLAQIRALPFVAPMIEAAERGGLRPDAIKVHTSPVTVRALPLDTAEAWPAPPEPSDPTSN